MWRPVLLIPVLALLTCEVEPARILGVFPIPSRSHQVVFRSLMQELAKRGHDVVTITPEPVIKKNTGLNVTEIDTSFVYPIFIEQIMKFGPELTHGVIFDINVILRNQAYIDFVDFVVMQIQSPQVQQLLNDKSQKFDLIFVEGFFEYHYIVSHIFKAPVIVFPSFMGFAEHYEMMGAIGRHPILYPHLNRMDSKDLSFSGVLKGLYYEYEMYKLMKRVEEKQNAYLKENFGPNVPTIQQLKENVAMLFLNANPFMANNRAVPPNIIYLGATHLLPPKPIPQDLKEYLDNSNRGVIYVSFGSNIRPSQMSKSYLDVLLKAFEDLPYDILWRFDGNTLENVPKNVKWHQWFPQRDLLFHPNIKAFVTQCGLQSMDEAIDAEVPLIGVPMMAEQWYNAQKFVDLGIGVKLDSMTLTSQDLVDGALTVVGNKSYKENIKRLKKIINDQPQTPLEKGVWWAEYIIRQKGAKHLRSPLADMPWTEYYMLSTFLPILGGLILVIVLLVVLLCKLFTAIVGESSEGQASTKKKVKRN